MSEKSRLSSCTFAVLTTPSDSVAATRLQPITTNEYATPFGSSDGEVELSEHDRMATTAARSPAMAARREYGESMWSSFGERVSRPAVRSEPGNSKCHVTDA